MRRPDARARAAEPLAPAARPEGDVPRRISRSAVALALAGGAWASGCSDCGRAPRAEARDDAAGPASAAPSASGPPSAGGPPPAGASAAADAPAATVIARGLGKPRALVVDATHVYFADTLARTIGRVPRDGGAPEDVAIGREAPARLAFSGDELVWLDGGGPLPAAPDAGAVARGVFACSPAKVPCSVRTVRAGSFVTLVAAGAELFVAENLGSSRFAVSRVTDKALTRVGEHDGHAMAMTTDGSSLYVATSSALDRAKVVTLPLAKGATREVTLRGPGLNNIDDDGDELLGTGMIDRRFGLFLLAKSGDDVAFAAPDVAPGLYARRGDVIYFVGGADRSLRRVPRAGGTATVVGRLTGIDEPSGLAIADGWAYVGGKAAGDAGSTGTIVRIPLP